MSSRVRAVVVIAAVVVLAGGGLSVHKLRSRRSAVEVKLRLSVSPKEKMDFVLGQARSAKLKYEVGKEAGLQGGLSQRLSVEPVLNSAVVLVELGVPTKESGQRLAEAFLRTLQARCGQDVALAVVQQSIQ